MITHIHMHSSNGTISGRAGEALARIYRAESLSSLFV